MKTMIAFLTFLTATLSCLPQANAAYFADGMVINGTASVATAAGTTTLTRASKQYQSFYGSSTQTVVLPDATAMREGGGFWISNDSTGVVTVNYNGGSLATTLSTGEFAYFLLIDNPSAAGTWDILRVGPVSGVALTASRAVVTDAGGALASSATTATELGYVNGVTSSLCGISQSCTLTTKTLAVGSNSITGTADRVAQFGSGGSLEAGSVTTTQLGYLAAATASNTASTLVLRDGSGNFAAGTITAALTGNASTATALAANPSDCGAGNMATTIAANGDLTCAQVADAYVAAGAAIDRTKLASGTADHVLINNGSGVMSSEVTLSKSRGGTAQDNSSLTFPASGTVPAYTPVNHGVVISGSGAAAAVTTAGTAGQILTSNGASSDPTFQDPAAAPSQSYELSNVGLAASVAANALTIALKQSDGSSDCSAGGPCKIGFRNATLTTGGYSQVSVTGSLSTVISSGSTAGCSNGVVCVLYVYAINNAGTAELAWSKTLFDSQGDVVSTTAEGGAGAADSGAVMYSTTARSNVAYRLVSQVTSTQATAGTWATSPSQISLIPFDTKRALVWSGYHTNTSNWGTSSATYADPSGGTPTLTEHMNQGMGTVSSAGSSLPGITFTPARIGLYKITAHVAVLASTASYGSVRMVDGSNNVLDPGRAINITTNNFGHMHLTGLYRADSLSAVTIKLQLATSAGTFQIYTGPATGSAAIQWILEAL